MKAMISGFVLALVVAFCAPLVLNQMGWSTAEHYTTEQNVRFD
jgi:hypothetical protein